MKNKVITVIIILLALAGIAFLSYPTISNWLYNRNASGLISNYNQEVSKLEKEAKELEFAKAQAYNDRLLTAGYPIQDAFFAEDEDLVADYMDILNISQDGIMAYLEIEKINARLPIYHGTGEHVLERGVGHMRQTAMPIGGIGHHGVLTGHSGTHHARIFTDLEKLELGDIFLIHVMTETLAYQVDNILVVTPDNTSDLYPVPGEDYITLVTCTPYGINSHRLLVRGERIPYQPDRSADDGYVILVLPYLLFIGLVLTGGVVVVVYRHKKKKTTSVTVV